MSLDAVTLGGPYDGGGTTSPLGLTVSRFVTVSGSIVEATAPAA